MWMGLREFVHMKDGRNAGFKMGNWIGEKR